MELRTLNNQDGIALGPILFIIAILAILAAAIAAGNGGFNANTTTDSAKISFGIEQFSTHFARCCRKRRRVSSGEQLQRTSQISFQNGII